MATIKRRALPSPSLCARQQQKVPISSGQQCLSHTSCPDFPRRKNPTMDACLQPIFLISVAPPGHRLRRLWRTASSSLSEANLFISTKCCSRGSVLFFRASPRLLIGSENIKEAKLGMSWFILHLDLINFVAVTIRAPCVNFGEVALSPRHPPIPPPPPTAVLRNELEQLFLGLKPDGAAVFLKQKMSNIFSVHAKIPSNPVGTETFLRYSDWTVISSVGSICVAQDGRGSRLHVCSSQSDLAICLIDRWSSCIDLRARTCRTDRRCCSGHCLRVAPWRPVTFPLMAEDQEHAQNIVFFFLIIQRDVAAYVQTPFISQPGWNLEALLLRKSTLSAVTYYIFSGLCNRFLWQGWEKG